MILTYQCSRVWLLPSTSYFLPTESFFLRTRPQTCIMETSTLVCAAIYLDKDMLLEISETLWMEKYLNPKIRTPPYITLFEMDKHKIWFVHFLTLWAAAEEQCWRERTCTQTDGQTRRAYNAFLRTCVHSFNRLRRGCCTLSGWICGYTFPTDQPVMVI